MTITATVAITCALLLLGHYLNRMATASHAQRVRDLRVRALLEDLEILRLLQQHRGLVLRDAVAASLTQRLQQRSAMPDPHAVAADWAQLRGTPADFDGHSRLIDSLIAAIDEREPLGQACRTLEDVARLRGLCVLASNQGGCTPGLQARLMSQALRKMTGALYNSGTTAIFINQLREKIGVMFGSPETTTGGKALKFYASVRCDVRRIQTLKDGQDSIGNRTKMKVVKNKVSPPFKIAEFDIMYGEGISRESSIIDMGVENGIVKKSGSWFTYEGDQLGQGKEKARIFLKENPDLANEIEDKIFQALHVGKYANPTDELTDDPVDMVPNIDFDDEDEVAPATAE